MKAKDNIPSKRISIVSIKMVREVFKPEILSNSASIILFHNHPSILHRQERYKEKRDNFKNYNKFK